MRGETGADEGRTRDRLRRLECFQGEGGEFLERQDEEPASDDAKDQPWQIEVELRRKGELALLLPFRLTFADGSVQDLVWTREEQQAATWKRLEFESESKLVSAVIDPERRYFLDRDMSNDRWFDETDRVAPWRWAERVFSQYQRYLFWISGLGG